MTVYDIGDGAEVEFKDGVVHIRGKPPYANFRISLKDEDAKVLASRLMKELVKPADGSVIVDIPVPSITRTPSSTTLTTSTRKPARKKKVTKDEEKED